MKKIISKLEAAVRYGFTMKQLINYINFSLQRKRKKEVLSYRPLWLLVYVTDLCNLSCKMCPHHTEADSSQFVYKKKLNKNHISLDCLEKIFDRFSESYLVMLAGVGEPLLHPNFKKLVELCRMKRKKVNLVTNGTLLSAFMAEFLSKNKAINQVSISLNAPNSVVYHDICGGDEKEFETVIQNIKRLVQCKKQYNSQMEVVVSGVCSQQFVEHAKNFLVFASKLDVDRIDLHRYIDFNIQGNYLDKLCDEDFFNDLEEFVHKYIKTKVNLPHRVSKELFKKKCDWYFKSLSFDSKGNMGSCGRVMSPDEGYGNIRDKEDIWNNQYMRSMRRRFLNESAELVTQCYTCVENYQSK
ncbi:MAG: radical SAM protein [Candidatus Brocadiae bacterium]|nr:radical SAM protein [Candidatus Brocadiia bacterium]